MPFVPFDEEMTDLFQESWLSEDPDANSGSIPTVLDPEQAPIGLYVPAEQEPAATAAAAADVPSTAASFVDPSMLGLDGTDGDFLAGFQPLDNGMTDPMDVDNMPDHQAEFPTPLGGLNDSLVSGNFINLDDTSHLDIFLNLDNAVAAPETSTPNPLVYYSPPKVQHIQPNSWQLGPRSAWDAYQPSNFPVSSAGHEFEQFYIKFDYRPLPPSRSLREPKAAKMYVEKYTPREPKWAYPIVLVHGDFHTGKIWATKPDGKQGWAAFFINKGFTVYVVDLPACGRSIEFDQSIVQWSKYASCTAKLTRDNAEATCTAASKFQRWPDAHKHTQWPGNGLRDDGIFETYMASTVPLYFRRHERQAIGKAALTKLVQRTGPAILLGEGSGATLSYLAADALPDTVKAVLAVEPAGPPGGTNRALKDNTLVFTNQVRYFAQHRPYGLADIPLTFEPAVPEPAYDEHGVTQPPLELFATAAGTNNGVCLLQRGGPELRQADTTGRVLPPEARPGVVRKLAALGRVCQLVVTAEASHHATCDGATVAFMRQAGVGVDHIRLEEAGVCGNGHLMYLEKNSDAVAQVIFEWVASRVPGASL
ncbi:hypothetical protein H634G_10557 [Metarhizium anisopliae BRIP 53293]|uniref:AB hydrolase-1 domain-containing protein n=1 Tax=Metarhizium anisopliae BRIP 53293 TaxID=1291518 RepID=A0A0D9NJQ5_METAN|nr:hypothetical protein H634G_10557 [Metarhizium anisopliae BRIP 53293]